METANESENRQPTNLFHGHRIVETGTIDAESTLSDILRDFRREGYLQQAINSLAVPDEEYIGKFWEFLASLKGLEDGVMIAPLLSHGYISENMIINNEHDVDPLFDEMIDGNTDHDLRQMFSVVLHEVKFIFDIIESYDSVLSMHKGISNDMRLHHCAYSLVLSYDNLVDLGIDKNFIERYKESTKYFGGDRVTEIDIPTEDD